MKIKGNDSIIELDGATYVRVAAFGHLHALLEKAGFSKQSLFQLSELEDEWIAQLKDELHDD